MLHGLAMLTVAGCEYLNCELPCLPHRRDLCGASVFFTFYLNVARLRIRKLFWYQVLQKVPYPKLPGIGMNYPRLGTGIAASLANMVQP